MHIEKLILKSIKKVMGLKQLKLSWQESSGGITHPILRAYCIATVIKGRDIDTAMEQNKDSRNGATEIQSIIVGKGEKAIQWKERNIFNK